MTTTPQTTPLDREQVETKIRAWFAAGLPKGEIYFYDYDEELRAHIHMPDPNSVAVWAEALGQIVEARHGVFMTSRCEPLDLGGCRLEVWCYAPGVAAELKIAVRGTSS